MPTTEFSKPAAGKEMVQASASEFIERAAQAIGGSVKEVKVNETRESSSEDIKEFLRSVLGKERFCKSYSLFNGAISVVFQTRLAFENLAAKAKANTAPLSMQSQMYSLYKFAHSLKELRLADGEKITSKNLVAQASADQTMWSGSDTEYNLQPIQNLSDIVYAALFGEAFNDFESLCDLFFQKAREPDFWKGTAGRT